MSWIVPVAQPVLGSRERQLLSQVMAEGRITQGRFVAAFEKRVAKYCRVPYAAAMASGTAAVHAALMALEIGAGDEVITSPLSCIASANPILFQGAKPVFADIDPVTYNMDLSLLEKKITRRTKAILAVHLLGKPLDMESVMRIAKRHKLAVIEDACQSFGALLHGRAVGSFGDIGIFSFYANKIITTAEGGMAITKNAKLYRRLCSVRNLGQENAPFHHPWIGGNFKMSNLHAAIGLAQMERLDGFIARRRAIAKIFSDAFRMLRQIRQLPLEGRDERHVFFAYPIEVDSLSIKNKLAKALTRAGIETRPLLSVIPDEPSYRRLRYSGKSVPQSMAAYQRTLYVSCSPALTSTQIKRVIATVQKTLS